MTTTTPDLGDAARDVDGLQRDDLARIGRSLETVILLLRPVLEQQRALLGAEQAREAARARAWDAAAVLLGSVYIRPPLVLALLSLSAWALAAAGLPVEQAWSWLPVGAP